MQFVRWQQYEARKESPSPVSPFATQGCKRAAYAVYESVRRGHHLFAEAPTGIEKPYQLYFPC